MDMLLIDSWFTYLDLIYINKNHRTWGKLTPWRTHRSERPGLTAGMSTESHSELSQNGGPLYPQNSIGHQFPMKTTMNWGSPHHVQRKKQLISSDLALCSVHISRLSRFPPYSVVRLENRTVSSKRSNEDSTLFTLTAGALPIEHCNWLVGVCWDCTELTSVDVWKHYFQHLRKRCYFSSTTDSSQSPSTFSHLAVGCPVEFHHLLHMFVNEVKFRVDALGEKWCTWHLASCHAKKPLEVFENESFISFLKHNSFLITHIHWSYGSKLKVISIFQKHSPSGLQGQPTGKR